MNKKIITVQDYIGYVAHYEGECEDPEHRDKWGRGRTGQEAIDDLLEQEDK